MAGKYQFSTLQANRAVNGDFSSAYSTIDGIGIGIYVGVSGDVEIDLLAPGPDAGATSVVFTAVPQGTFMQVPLFEQVSSGSTTSTDLTIMYLAPPYR